MKQIGNIMRYIVIVLLDIAVMLVFHSYINFLLLIGLILFPVYSFVGVMQARDKLSVRIEAPFEPMVRGEEFDVRFIITNESWFPLVNVNLELDVSNMFYGNLGKHVLNIPVRAKKETKVTYPVVMEYCGRFHIEVSGILLMDVLGIRELKKKVNESAECLVLPCGIERNKEAGQIYLRGITEAMESKERGYDFSDVTGIREYIPGDKLQDIHWKLSVKKDELMVKERVNMSAMQLNILVDISNDENMCAEGVLELSDSVTKAFVTRNMPFTVHYYSNNVGELRSCYINNEIERRNWIEMMMYDSCYSGDIDLEASFLIKNPGGGSYLYIGRINGDIVDEDAILGDKMTAAILKNGTV